LENGVKKDELGVSCESCEAEVCTGFLEALGRFRLKFEDNIKKDVSK